MLVAPRRRVAHGHDHPRHPVWLNIVKIALAQQVHIVAAHIMGVGPDRTGGAYRLASIAVDIETGLLGRRSRRVSDVLRLRRRLWRRWSRVRVRHLDSATGPNAAAEKMREAP